MIAAASKAEPDAGHYVDDRTDFAVSMGEADLCVCDISAMAMDWLPRNRPLLITKPADTEAVVDENGIAGVVPLLSAEDSANVVPLLRDLASKPTSGQQSELVQQVFGDTSPGASTRRFIDAVEAALAEARL